MIKPSEPSIDRDEQTTETSPGIVLALTLEQAAKALNVSERTFWSLWNAGEIRSFRIGRARRFPVAEIQRYIDEQCELDESQDFPTNKGHENLRRQGHK
jgi:excisionase family DNA binding protein